MMGLIDYIRKRRVNQVLDPTKSRPVPEITNIVEGKRYSTLDAKCIAQGLWAMFFYVWLMQTNKNNFFIVQIPSLGSIDSSFASITPCDQETAIKFFSNLTLREVKFEQAFPNIEVSDA